jgi:DegV family protein with EDD domain
MINIIADSLCGIPARERPRLGIPFISQFVIIDGRPYRDATEIDLPTLLEKMKGSSEVLQTAPPHPEDYIPLFRQLAKPGDTAIVIGPSKEISGTYRAAWVAKQEFPNSDIRIIDTGTISSALGSIVLQALFWVKQGWDADHIAAGVAGMAARDRTYFLVDTLEYMRKAGRIGGAAALLGTLMNIKPILTLKEGTVEVLEKIRSLKAAQERMKELVEAECPRKPEAWLSISQASSSETSIEMANYFKAKLGFQYVPIYEEPPAIVVNTGPNILGISFFVNE